MEIQITTFTNPFSFFCISDTHYDGSAGAKLLSPGDNPASFRANVTSVVHGQYVAVLWNKKWVRGIVSMENQFLIWLVDYGVYVKGSEVTTVIDLPANDKKVPTKVYEASIHGVMPIDKVISDRCEIVDTISVTWTLGAITQAQEIIKKAKKIFLVPAALLSTNCNDVVIGDLYLQIPERGFVNLIEELEQWPVFLRRNKTMYVESLAQFYRTRRRHRACAMKPDLADLPPMAVTSSYADYSAICAKMPAFEPALDNVTLSGGSSIVVNKQQRRNEDLKLTPQEIEQYSQMYVTIAGREFNVLNVLRNKTRDLVMCEKYKDHDTKGVGRGVCFRKY